MRKGKSPKYVFLAACLRLQAAQEYLMLLKAVRGPYAAAVRQNFFAELAGLYGSAGPSGEKGCLEALRERCAELPAFSGSEGTQLLEEISELCRRCGTLLAEAPSPGAVSLFEAEQLTADTEAVLREIETRLFAAPGPRDSFGFLRKQYLQESR